MDRTTTYVHEPTDTGEIGRLAELYRDRGEFTGPPVVVFTDPGTEKVWVVSDPHRHAAALRAGVELPTVELTQLFREAGRDYAADLTRVREGPEVIAEQVFVGSRMWMERVVGLLPEETRRRFWTENWEATLP